MNNIEKIQKFCEDEKIKYEVDLGETSSITNLRMKIIIYKSYDFRIKENCKKYANSVINIRKRITRGMGEEKEVLKDE